MFAQRLGGDDVAAGGQHFAAELRIEVVQIGVAAQHQGLGANGTPGGMHAHLRAVIDACDGRLLEQSDAQLLRCCGFAQRQIQRVQMAGTHVDQTTDVAFGADHGVHFMGLQQSGFVSITEAAQFFGIICKAFEVRRLVGEVAIAPGQIAGNLKTLDALTDNFHGFQAHEFHLPHAIGADHVCELIKTMANPANQLPAVATAGAPADLVRFQQHHAEAAFGQFQRGVQPGKATADHAHVRNHLALQQRMVRLRQAAGGVIRGGVRLARGGVGAGSHGRHPERGVEKI